MSSHRFETGGSQESSGIGRTHKNPLYTKSVQISSATRRLGILTACGPGRVVQILILCARSEGFAFRAGVGVSG